MRYEITGTTRLTCLLGSPVAHSISPQMHNEAFRLLGLDYVYTAFDISPQNLPDAVHALKLLNVRGYNLTMPPQDCNPSLYGRADPRCKAGAGSQHRNL